MYNPLPDSLTIKPSGINGLGLFAQKGIAQGTNLGVTKNAVIGKVHRLGLTKRGSPIRPKSKPAEVISLAALRPDMCSWPEGEPGTKEFHFCGELAVPEKPYCADHCRRAYVTITKDGKKTVAA